MRDNEDQIDEEQPGDVQDVKAERSPLELPTPTDLHEKDWDEGFDRQDPEALVPFGLSPRQWRFCCEYLKDFNGLRAAHRAGYSKKSPTVATKIMSRPKVRDALRWLLNTRAKLYSVAHDRILQELAIIAFSDQYDYAEWDSGGVRWRDASTIPPHKRHAVKAIEYREQEGKYGTTKTTKIILESKTKALELLMKATGMMREVETDDNRGAFKKWADAMLSGEIKPARRELPEPEVPRDEEQGKHPGEEGEL